VQDISSFMTSYFFPMLIVFSGIIVGVVLGIIAPEELRPGKQYMKVFQNIVFALAVLILMFMFELPIWAILVAAIVVTVAELLYFDSDISIAAYTVFALLFFISSKQQSIFVVESSLIFLYGLPTGSMYLLDNLKKSSAVIFADIFLNYGIFIVIGLITNLVRIAGTGTV
jgi:hypothetical protein